MILSRLQSITHPSLFGQVCAAATEDTQAEIVQMIKDQFKDNPVMVAGIVGSELLAEIINETI